MKHITATSQTTHFIYTINKKIQLMPANL